MLIFCVGCASEGRSNGPMRASAPTGAQQKRQRSPLTVWPMASHLLQGDVPELTLPGFAPRGDTSNKGARRPPCAWSLRVGFVKGRGSRNTLPLTASLVTFCASRKSPPGGCRRTRADVGIGPYGCVAKSALRDHASPMRNARLPSDSGWSAGCVAPMRSPSLRSIRAAHHGSASNGAPPKPSTAGSVGKGGATQ